MDNNKYRYNTAVKRILSDKNIPAVILNAVVPEYRESSKEDIRDKYIQGNVRDSIDDTLRMINASGSGVEDGAVTYDIRFDSLLPRKSNKHSKILINLEAQKDTKSLSYEPATRGIYYACNMVTSEYGTVFDHSHYEKIEKVYSIWICMTPSPEQAGSLTTYNITENQKRKNEQLNKEDYDKLEVVIYHIGGIEDASDGDYNVKEMTELITNTLDKDKSPQEVKEYLRIKHNIVIGRELEEDIDCMCNFADVIEERGIIKGRAEGLEQGVHQNKLDNALRMIADGELTLEKIASYTDLPLEKVQELVADKSA